MRDRETLQTPLFIPLTVKGNVMTVLSKDELGLLYGELRGCRQRVEQAVQPDISLQAVWEACVAPEHRQPLEAAARLISPRENMPLGYKLHFTSAGDREGETYDIRVTFTLRFPQDVLVPLAADPFAFASPETAARMDEWYALLVPLYVKTARLQSCIDLVNERAKNLAEMLAVIPQFGALFERLIARQGALAEGPASLHGLYVSPSVLPILVRRLIQKFETARKEKVRLSQAWGRTLPAEAAILGELLAQDVLLQDVLLQDAVLQKPPFRLSPSPVTISMRGPLTRDEMETMDI